MTYLSYDLHTSKQPVPVQPEIQNWARGGGCFPNDDRGRNILYESSATKIIESVLSNLELEGSDLATAPLKAGKNAISGDRGLETEETEAVEASSEDEEVP